jgi:hypothetical protein
VCGLVADRDRAGARFVVMYHLPTPVLAVQDERVPPISRVRAPADLALKVKGAARVGYVTEHIHRHVAHRHHPGPQETGDPLVVLLDRCPAPDGVGGSSGMEMMWA